MDATSIPTYHYHPLDYKHPYSYGGFFFNPQMPVSSAQNTCHYPLQYINWPVPHRCVSSFFTNTSTQIAYKDGTFFGAERPKYHNWPLKNDTLLMTPKTTRECTPVRLLETRGLWVWLVPNLSTGIWVWPQIWLSDQLPWLQAPSANDVDGDDDM